MNCPCLNVRRTSRFNDRFVEIDIDIPIPTTFATVVHDVGPLVVE